VVEGLMEWDRFRHREAWERLSVHLPLALAVAEAWGHGAKVRVLKGLEALLPHLKGIVEAGPKPTFLLLQDLLANAERRAALGRFDDALARLYRALELAVEADVHERLGFSLKDPRTWPEGFPEGLRSAFSSPEASWTFWTPPLTWTWPLGSRAPWPSASTGRKTAYRPSSKGGTKASWPTARGPWGKRTTPPCGTSS